jgi:uncharacterized protein YjiS (DUF1127 family)
LLETTSRALRGVRATFIRWLRASDARRQLERLDDHLLRDVGFDPHEARREAAKPFWREYTLRRRDI